MEDGKKTSTGERQQEKRQEDEETRSSRQARWDPPRCPLIVLAEGVVPWVAPVPSARVLLATRGRDDQAAASLPPPDRQYESAKPQSKLA